MLTVVTGPPCSGKTTYVREHKTPGDIVIDFDDLAQALGSPVRHGHADHLRYVTIATRRAAIDAAIRAHLRGATVWIVDCNITDRRSKAYEQAGAKVVALHADSDTLHRRAATERPRLWHRLIDDWQPQSQPVRSREW